MLFHHNLGCSYSTWSIFPLNLGIMFLCTLKGLLMLQSVRKAEFASSEMYLIGEPWGEVKKAEHNRCFLIKKAPRSRENKFRSLPRHS